MPFSNAVNYTDGDQVILQRRERPHLIFDKDGYITHLTSGVQVSDPHLILIILT